MTDRHAPDAGGGADGTPVDAAARERADRYAAAADGFAARVAAVTDWDAPTPVAEWRARDVVGHLVGWLPGMLGGGSDVAFEPVPPADDDPVGAWAAFDAQVRAILDDPVRSALPHRNPHTGEQPVGAVVDGFFTPDVVFHTWDLARSNGLDDRLDPAFVHDAFTGMTSLAELIRSSGQFGEQQPEPADATEQERLMAFLGRDPRWTPPTT